MAFTRTYFVTRWPRDIDITWLQRLLTHRGSVDVALHLAPMEPEAAVGKMESLLRQHGSTKALGREDLGTDVSLEDSQTWARPVARGAERLHELGLYLVVHGATPEELEEECTHALDACKGALLSVEPATFRQRRGLMTGLPLGADLLGMARTWPSSSVAEIFPFATGDVAGHPDTGILYGKSLATGAPVMVDRFRLPNHNQVVLATSGAGKSYAAKTQLALEQVAWEGELETTILDPDGEYEDLTELLGGRVVRSDFEARHGEPLLCYSLRDVDDDFLAQTAGDVLLGVWDRVRDESRRHIRKQVVVDEAYLMLVANPVAEHALAMMVKRSRKWGCGVTVISQDVQDLLDSTLGAAIIQNSATKLLLHQDSNVIGELARAFWLSEGEQDFLVAAPQGEGLLIFGDERARIEIEAPAFLHPHLRTDPGRLAAVSPAEPVEG